MVAVAPELRSPLLWIVSPTSTARNLPISRFAARLRTPSGSGVTVTERYAGDPAVRVLITTPSGTQSGRPSVLWIHGGGFVLGSPQFDAFVTAHIARELGAVVVSPDYRLAPEHPFPAALDDCMATLQWLRTYAEMLGTAPDRIAVGGASAGGGLAAAVAQRSHDEGIPLRAQGPDAPDYAAPARRMELDGLPPAWIGVGDLDLFYGEDVAYAEHLKACGVRCEFVTVPGMYHTADGIASKAASMQNFRRSMIDHLRLHLQAD